MAKHFVSYSQAKKKALYGSTAEKVREQLVLVRFDLGANKMDIKLHKKVAPYYKSAMADYCVKVAKGIAPAYHFKPKDCYSFCWRYMRDSSSILSAHSFGTAIDLNAFNPNGYPTKTKTDIHPELVKSFNKYGIFWGGDWSYPWDGMHFEWSPLSFPNRAVSGGAKKYKAGTIVKTGAKVALRDKPSAKGKKLGVLKKGKKLKVIKDYGKYLQVKGGFVHEDYVRAA